MHHTHLTRARWIPTHPPTALLLALLAEIGISLLPPARVALPWIVQLLGGVFVLCGIALNVAATSRFGRLGTPVSPAADPLTLVTRGVFAWTRNPMYLGFALIIGGAALALSTPWALALLPLYIAWVDPLIRTEEARLETVFGDAYASYQRRVRRWL